jgi:hypothetical protein
MSNAIATIFVALAVIIGSLGDISRSDRIEKLEQQVQQLGSKEK